MSRSDPSTPGDLNGSAGTALERLAFAARTRRRVVALSAYALASAVALVGAYALRFEFSVPASFLEALPLQLGLLMLLRVILAQGVGLTTGRWRFVGVDDVISLGIAGSMSSLLFLALLRLFPFLPTIPLSVVLIEWAIFTLGVAGVWLGYRKSMELLRGRRGPLPEGEPRRLIVVGSGEAGNFLVRELRRQPTAYQVIGFLDDDPLKQGTRAQGVPVLGEVARAPELLEGLEIDEVAIAIPSAGPPTLRRIVEELECLDLPVKVLPGIDQVMEGDAGPNQLRPLRIEDLLGRDPVSLELPKLEADLDGRTVLVTGAAGSIGSELARQVAANEPARLLLLDQAESDLYFVDLELRNAHPELDIVPIVADILDRSFMEGLFDRERPDRVYHAAAYKHVPLMEKNPRQALRNNVVGTWEVARLAGRVGTGRFVLISTDKAADPVNTMGRSKRAAEIVIQATQEEYPDTHFTAVRFGNVLGSNGSVVPLFQRQIAEGGPVTITHREVTRYFMTIPEAVQLVLQAGLLDEVKGRIAMLEMGEPVRIVDLARNMVRLQGLRPEVDIEFTYTGLRPGEKLHETLHGKGELVDATALPAVHCLSTREAPVANGALVAFMEELRRDGGDPRSVLSRLIATPTTNGKRPGKKTSSDGERHAAHA